MVSGSPAECVVDWRCQATEGAKMGAGSSMVMAFVLHKVGMTDQSQPCEGMVWWVWCVWCLCIQRWLRIGYQLGAFDRKVIIRFDQKLDRVGTFYSQPRTMVYKLSPSPNLHFSFPIKICRLTSSPSPNWMTLVGRP